MNKWTIKYKNRTAQYCPAHTNVVTHKRCIAIGLLSWNGIAHIKILPFWLVLSICAIFHFYYSLSACVTFLQTYFVMSSEARRMHTALLSMEEREGERMPIEILQTGKQSLMTNGIYSHNSAACSKNKRRAFLDPSKGWSTPAPSSHRWPNRWQWETSKHAKHNHNSLFTVYIW